MSGHGTIGNSRCGARTKKFGDPWPMLYPNIISRGVRCGSVSKRNFKYDGYSPRQLITALSWFWCTAASLITYPDKRHIFYIIYAILSNGKKMLFANGTWLEEMLFKMACKTPKSKISISIEDGALDLKIFLILIVNCKMRATCFKSTVKNFLCVYIGFAAICAIK